MNAKELLMSSVIIHKPTNVIIENVHKEMLFDGKELSLTFYKNDIAKAVGSSVEWKITLESIFLDIHLYDIETFAFSADELEVMREMLQPVQGKKEHSDVACKIKKELSRIKSKNL